MSNSFLEALLKGVGQTATQYGQQIIPYQQQQLQNQQYDEKQNYERGQDSLTQKLLQRQQGLAEERLKMQQEQAALERYYKQKEFELSQQPQVPTVDEQTASLYQQDPDLLKRSLLADIIAKENKGAGGGDAGKKDKPPAGVLSSMVGKAQSSYMSGREVPLDPTYPESKMLQPPVTQGTLDTLSTLGNNVMRQYGYDVPADTIFTKPQTGGGQVGTRERINGEWLDPGTVEQIRSQITDWDNLTDEKKLAVYHKWMSENGK